MADLTFYRKQYIFYLPSLNIVSPKTGFELQQNTAVLIAIGLKEDGHRDVLGLHLGNRESYYNWKDFLQSLKSRGLKRSELWISDEYDGLVKAIEKCFPGQLRQRCIIHWMHNAQSKVSETDLL